MTKDMFVQIFPGSETQDETAGHHRCRGRRRLRDNPRMKAHGRASDRGAEDKSGSRLSDTTDDGPYKRTLSLPIDPRMKMVRNHGERKTGLFRALGVADQLIRTKFLA